MTTSSDELLDELRTAYERIEEGEGDVFLVASLQELCTILCVGGETFIRNLNPLAFAEELLFLLSQMELSAEVRTLAARGLAILEDTVPRACDAVVSLGGVPTLIAAVADEVYLLQHELFADEALKCLSCLSLEVHDLLLEHNIVGVLMTVLPSLPDHQRALSLNCISNLFSTVKPGDWKALEPAVLLLQGILSSKLERLQAAAHRSHDTHHNRRQHSHSHVEQQEATTSGTLSALQRQKTEETIVKLMECFAHLVDRVVISAEMAERVLTTLNALLPTVASLLELASDYQSSSSPYLLRNAAFSVLLSLVTAAPRVAYRLFQQNHVFEVISACIQRCIGGDDATTGSSSTATVVEGAAPIGSTASNDSGSAFGLSLPHQEQYLVGFLEFLLAVLPSAKDTIDEYNWTVPHHVWMWGDEFHNRNEYDEMISRRLEAEYQRQRLERSFGAYDLHHGSRVYGVNFDFLRHVGRDGSLTRPFFRCPILVGFAHVKATEFGMLCACPSHESLISGIDGETTENRDDASSSRRRRSHDVGSGFASRRFGSSLGITSQALSHATREDDEEERSSSSVTCFGCCTPIGNWFRSKKSSLFRNGGDTASTTETQMESRGRSHHMMVGPRRGVGTPQNTSFASASHQSVALVSPAAPAAQHQASPQVSSLAYSQQGAISPSTSTNGNGIAPSMTLPPATVGPTPLGEVAAVGGAESISYNSVASSEAALPPSLGGSPCLTSTLPPSGKPIDVILTAVVVYIVPSLITVLRSSVNNVMARHCITLLLRCLRLVASSSSVGEGDAYVGSRMSKIADPIMSPEAAAAAKVRQGVLLDVLRPLAKDLTEVCCGVLRAASRDVANRLALPISFGSSREIERLYGASMLLRCGGLMPPVQGTHALTIQGEMFCMSCHLIVIMNRMFVVSDRALVDAYRDHHMLEVLASSADTLTAAGYAAASQQRNGNHNTSPLSASPHHASTSSSTTIRCLCHPSKQYALEIASACASEAAHALSSEAMALAQPAMMAIASSPMSQRKGASSSSEQQQGGGGGVAWCVGTAIPTFLLTNVRSVNPLVSTSSLVGGGSASSTEGSLHVRASDSDGSPSFIGAKSTTRGATDNNELCQSALTVVDVDTVETSEDGGVGVGGRFASPMTAPAVAGGAAAADASPLEQLALLSAFMQEGHMTVSDVYRVNPLYFVSVADQIVRMSMKRKLLDKVSETSPFLVASAAKEASSENLSVQQNLRLFELYRQLMSFVNNRVALSGSGGIVDPVVLGLQSASAVALNGTPQSPGVSTRASSSSTVSILQQAMLDKVSRPLSLRLRWLSAAQHSPSCVPFGPFLQPGDDDDVEDDIAVGCFLFATIRHIQEALALRISQRRWRLATRNNKAVATATTPACDIGSTAFPTSTTLPEGYPMQQADEAFEVHSDTPAQRSVLERGAIDSMGSNIMPLPTDEAATGSRTQEEQEREERIESQEDSSPESAVGLPQHHVSVVPALLPGTVDSDSAHRRFMAANQSHPYTDSEDGIDDEETSEVTPQQSLERRGEEEVSPQRGQALRDGREGEEVVRGAAAQTAAHQGNIFDEVPLVPVDPQQILIALEGVPLLDPNRTLLDSLIAYSPSAAPLRRLLESPTTTLSKSSIHKAFALWSLQQVLGFAVASQPLATPSLSKVPCSCAGSGSRRRLSSNWSSSRVVCHPFHYYEAIRAKQDGSDIDCALRLLNALAPVVGGLETKVATGVDAFNDGASRKWALRSMESRRLSSALIHDLQSQPLSIAIPATGPLCHAAANSDAAVDDALASFALWNYPLLYPLRLRISVLASLINSKKLLLPSPTLIVPLLNMTSSSTTIGMEWMVDVVPQMSIERLVLAHHNPALSSSNSAPRKVKAIMCRGEGALERGIYTLRRISNCPLPLDVEFVGEPGTGLGPTVEFFTIMAAALTDGSLPLWAGEEEKSMTHQDEEEEKESILPPSKQSNWRTSALLYPRIVVDSDRRREQLDYFEAIGLLIGRALQDGRTVSLPLHPAFVRRLQCVSLAMEDLPLCMHSVDPTLERSLEVLQQLSAADLEACDVTFSLPGYAEIELCPGGSQVSVNKSNVSAYCDSVRRYMLDTAMEEPVNHVLQGLSKTSVHPRYLQIFTDDELLYVLCGSPGRLWHNADAFRSIVLTAHGYHMKSRVVEDLVQVVGNWNEQDQRRFLQFISGSDRLPLSGLEPKLTVVKRDVDASATPSRASKLRSSAERAGSNGLLSTPPPAMDPTMSDSNATPTTATMEGSPRDHGDTFIKKIETPTAPSVDDGNSGEQHRSPMVTTLPSPTSALTPTNNKESTRSANAADQERQDLLDECLPTVNTCFHYLKLPEYSTREVLEDRLRLAIYEGQNQFMLS